MSEEQIKDMILKQCLELTTNNDFRPPISAYDGVDINDVVRTCKQLQDKKAYLDLVKENQELKKQLEKLQEEYIEFQEKASDIQFELRDDRDNYYERLQDKYREQKEFINWLKAMSKMYEEQYKDIDVAEHYNCVEKKYKEIIGDDK